MKEKNLLVSNIFVGYVKVNDYKCPKCGNLHNDNDGGYEVNNVKYPQYINESKGADMDGRYHDWNELHRCQNCGTGYWFENGAY